MTGRSSYETRAVLILCVTFGIVNLEMFGISYVMPFVQSGLRLDGTEVGLLLSGYWVTFSASSYFVSVFADRGGRRKRLLATTLFLFSILSILSGLATSFRSLVAARLLMGLLEGPVLPLAQSIVALESSPSRRGFNMGIVQGVGSGMLSAFLGPLLLTYVVTHYDWRAAFFVVAVPGLICSILTAVAIREPAEPRIRVEGTPTVAVSAGPALLRSRNVWLCGFGAALLVAFITIATGFLPGYYARVRHFSPESLGVLMSILGLSGSVLGVALPALSDRIGRKPVIVAACAAGATSLAVIACYPLRPGALGALVFVASMPAAVSALYFATVPAESVSPQHVATVIGVMLAFGTLTGGVAGPAMAGWCADRWNPSTPILIAAGCALGAALSALALRETLARNVTSGWALAARRAVRRPSV